MSSKTNIQAIDYQNNTRNKREPAETNQSYTLLKQQDVKVKELTKKPKSNIEKAGSAEEGALLKNKLTTTLRGIIKLCCITYFRAIAHQINIPTFVQ